MIEGALPDFRSVDPFAFWPRRASALGVREGSGFDEAGGGAGYVFHTAYLPQAPGMFRFRGRFGGLEAVGGSIILRVNELGTDEGTAATCIATETLPLADLRGRGGLFTIDVAAREGHRYALLGTLSGGAPSGETVARARSLEITASGQDAAIEMYRAALRHARDTVFCRAALFPGTYKTATGEPSLAIPVSQACTATQFEERDYARWIDALQRRMHRHRKQWEFVYILHALEYYGALRPGARGLGFGVGEEPLPALMAAMGATVTATDLPPEDDRVADWSGTGQHSSSLAGLSQPNLIADEDLARAVDFRAVDMTRIPDDLVGYDYTWSSCALEHVGSIVRGLDFIERSIACLRPGGVAVHTTELNLLSDDATLDHAGTVLFRRRDFEEIAARLTLTGHEVMPLNFTAGSTPLDEHIDVPPFASDDHLKLVISRYLTTSFGLIVRRGGA